NSGGILPEISIKLSDDEFTSRDTVTPIITATNDDLTVKIIDIKTIIEDDVLTVKGKEVASINIQDEEGDAILTLENTDAYYEISEDKIVLTQAGAELVNSGGILPEISIKLSDDEFTSRDTVTPIILPINEGLNLDIDTEYIITKKQVDTNTVVAKASTDDIDDGDITYSIDNNNFKIDNNGIITLSQIGVDLVNSGKHLPAFNITAISTSGNTDKENINPNDTTYNVISIEGSNTENYLELAKAQKIFGDASSFDISMRINSDGPSSGGSSLLSYANKQSHNEVLIWINSSGQPYLYIGRSYRSLSSENILDGKDHDIRTSWKSSTGETKFYLDGVELYSGTFKVGHIIDRSKAILNFGQEQDSIGGRFDSNQSFNGEYLDIKISVNGKERAHWGMDSITDDGKIIDLSGRGRDLTINGTVKLVSREIVIDEVNNMKSLNSQIIIEEDFEVSTDGWKIDFEGDAIYSKMYNVDAELRYGNENTGNYLGGFPGSDEYNGLHGNTKLYKTFDLGVDHANEDVKIEFDFYEIDSWDEDEDSFSVKINNELIAKDKFNGYINPSIFLDDSKDGGEKIGELGTYEDSYYNGNDEKHHYFIINKADENGLVKIELISKLDQGSRDESWGIDNFSLLTISPDSIEDIKLNFDKSTYKTPIILDLDNDGIETISLEHGVKFDIDADGDLDLTGWVGKDDALLVRDINNDEIINNSSELFGEETIKNDGSKAKDGYEALRELDSNEDGVINSLDEKFNELKVWKDINSDGTTDEGELLSLKDSNISEISLQTISSNEDSNGNIIGLKSIYLDNDGNEKEVADVWFKTEASDLVLEDDINLEKAIKVESATLSEINNSNDIDLSNVLSIEEEYEFVTFVESEEKLILKGGEDNWNKLSSEKIDNEEFEVYSTFDVNSQIKIFIDSSIEVDI
ncbi:MAG: hypothetical protein HRT40_03180, partial [Campylobacteraceae bacterium]|nr:hypothetical protein [Campylobacteraceae bacterium]